MEPITHTSYLDHLQRESTRFRDVLSHTDPTRTVPTCPEWNAADLLWHLTEVQWFWGQIVSRRPDGPEEFERPGRPGSYEGLLTDFDEHFDVLRAALASAAPTERAWTWSREQTVGFTSRRQAHEALIHRVDAELTAGQSPTPLDPELAFDGIDEVLGVMRSGAPDGCEFGALPHYVQVRATDLDRSLWLQLGHYTDAEGDHEAILLLDAAPAGDADAVLEGTASDLDLWLWRRADGATLAVHGDRTLLDHAKTVLHRPIL